MPPVDYALTLEVDRVDEELLGEFGRRCARSFHLVDICACAEGNGRREQSAG
jgi:hypothetical protein